MRFGRQRTCTDQKQKLTDSRAPFLSISLRDKLMDLSFRFLSYRPRSAHEIRSYLQKKAASFFKKAETSIKSKSDMVDIVFVRLQELGYIDDSKFVNWWVEERFRTNPKSKRYMKFELLQKGVPKEVIDDCFAKLFLVSESEDELSLAKKAVEKKLRHLRILPELERKRKLFAFLARRGFSSHTAYRLIDELEEKGYNLA